MNKFLGSVSIADAMGNLYGQKVRLITAIAAVIGSAGLIAVQFKVFGNIISYFTVIPSSYAIIVSGLIATTYSAFGGIRSVTITDVMQGFAFGIIIPLLGFAIWIHFYDLGYSFSTLVQDPHFNPSKLFDSSNNGFWGFVFIFFYFSLPMVSASEFQRISMGRDIKQVQNVFITSAIILMIIKIAIAQIPVMLYAINPNLQPTELLGFIIDNYTFVGLKGLIIIAVIAFAMSTADSTINSVSVIFTHDIYSQIFPNKRNELFVVRFFAFILGVFTIFISLYETDLLDIIIFTGSFYWPLVSPPFLLALFGFRTSASNIIAGMGMACIITVVWKFLPDGTLPFSQNIIGFMVALGVNAFVLLSAHYLTGSEGGWEFSKDDDSSAKKVNSSKNFISSISRLLDDTIPKTDATYSAVGIYFLMYTVTTMYSIGSIEQLGNRQFLNIAYSFMLVLSTCIAMYQIWPSFATDKMKIKVVHSFYLISIFSMLILLNIFFLILSNLSVLQMSVFILNLIVACLLLGWQLAVSGIIIGLFSGVKLFATLFPNQQFLGSLGTPELILVYTLLIIVSVIIFFVKPIEERRKSSEERAANLETEVKYLDFKNNKLNVEVANLDYKVKHYSERISDQEAEIERLGATAQRILNNVNHELRLPIGNVMNFAEMLKDGIKKLDKKHIEMLSDEVYQNSNRVSSMIMNMLDLATLSAGEIVLQKRRINLTELVEDRISTCREMYLGEKNISFKLILQPEIFVDVDPNYMRQVIDNLVINAINFSEKGMIVVQLISREEIAEFTIMDEGIGIPQLEIYDIFSPFKMGSNTQSKAEGRGVGLALCKTAIEAHGGKISAKSKNIGAEFSFELKAIKLF